MVNFYPGLTAKISKKIAWAKLSHDPYYTIGTVMIICIVPVPKHKDFDDRYFQQKKRPFLPPDVRKIPHSLRRLPVIIMPWCPRGSKVVIPWKIRCPQRFTF